MPATSRRTAVVIIPTYNERENIEPLFKALTPVIKSIADWQMKVLIVDDTSPDKTYDEVKRLSKKYSFVNLLINKKKAGLGAAYLAGMEHAVAKMDADVLFEFDADLSHDPTKIPLFLKEIEAGYDMVIGSRYIPGGAIPDDWGLHRKFLSIVGNIFIMTVLTNFSVRDWTSGYRALTKELYQSIKSELKTKRFSGYTFQIGSLYLTFKKGFHVTEVPFKFIDRTYGESKLGPEYIKNNLMFILKMRAMEIVKMRFFKFAFVGGIGAVIQLTSLTFFQQLPFLPFQLAFFLAIEMAVLSNFILNNLWTFADKKLELTEMPIKFISFNVASSGSIIIQQSIGILGEWLIGLHDLFVLPVISLMVTTGHLFAVVGIGIGLFWNFFAYNKFIWNKSKKNKK